MIVVVAVMVNISKGVFVRQDIINNENKQQSTTHFNESCTRDIEGGRQWQNRLVCEGSGRWRCDAVATKRLQGKAAARQSERKHIAKAFELEPS